MTGRCIKCRDLLAARLYAEMEEQVVREDLTARLRGLDDVTDQRLAWQRSAECELEDAVAACVHHREEQVFGKSARE